MTFIKSSFTGEAAAQKKRWPVYTMEEVSKHNTRDDCWLVVLGKVYCVTSWLPSHPGGYLPIVAMAGKDCTDAFIGFHPRQVLEKKLPLFQVGELDTWQQTELQKDFYAIRDALFEEGRFRSDYVWYSKKAAFQITMYLLAVAILLAGSNIWHFMLSALVLGVYWQQLSFFGHDFGHNSVTHDRTKDWIGGQVINLTYGVSGLWWKRTHNMHHILTNSVEYDPDIQHLPVFAVTNKIFPGFYSFYHECRMGFTRASRLLVGYQHWLYYPVMAVARFNLYVQSYLLILQGKDRQGTTSASSWSSSSSPSLAWLDRQLASATLRAIVELCSLTGFWIQYICLMCLLPDWHTRLVYTLICHAVCGFIHVQITLSHFAMHTYHGPGYTGEAEKSDHFIRNAFASTMNVECAPYMDWLHGGLQFQIEHHLFPRLARHHLRYAKETYIVPFCKKHNLTYHSYPFWEANRRVFCTLRDAALEARRTPVGDDIPTDESLASLIDCTPSSSSSPVLRGRRKSHSPVLASTSALWDSSERKCSSRSRHGINRSPSDSSSEPGHTQQRGRVRTRGRRSSAPSAPTSAGSLVSPSDFCRSDLNSRIHKAKSLAETNFLWKFIMCEG